MTRRRERDGRQAGRYSYVLSTAKPTPSHPELANSAKLILLFGRAVGKERREGRCSCSRGRGLSSAQAHVEPATGPRQEICGRQFECTAAYSSVARRRRQGQEAQKEKSAIFLGGGGG